MGKGNRPTLVKGTRDLSAEQIFKRDYILNIIKSAYKKYGFLPLETPALEQIETLTGKYGQEGDQLLFRILNSGDFLRTATPHEQDYKKVASQIAEKGLRYDLTVPLMRHIATNHTQLTFPFRRYQIQPVWRADRPQKGRYREFHQCDIDVVGTESLLCEAEIIVLIHEVLQQLGIENFTIHLNHRAILHGLSAAIDAEGQEEALCTALDKLDKVGVDNVKEELQRKGFSPSMLHKLAFLFDLPTHESEKWSILQEQLAETQKGTEGLQALQQILTYVQQLGIENPAVSFDPTLARGLSYYTGAIFEVKIKDTAWGSIGGGGRYDGLTDVFGLPNMAGIGFSFGLDRLYEVLEDLALFPADVAHNPQSIMIASLDAQSIPWALHVLRTLRQHNIQAELYPEPVKIKKQMQYAHKRQLAWVAIIGEEERTNKQVSLKNMQTGVQEICSIDNLIKELM